MIAIVQAGEVKQRAEAGDVDILLSSPELQMGCDGITLLLTHGALCFSNAYLDGLAQSSRAKACEQARYAIR